LFVRQDISTRSLKIQRYVATIFPKNKDNTRDILQSDAKSAFFEELEGGTREYILTLSSIITDSKMKGSPVCCQLFERIFSKPASLKFGRYRKPQK
jgi:hypothetical protein